MRVLCAVTKLRDILRRRPAFAVLKGQIAELYAVIGLVADGKTLMLKVFRIGKEGLFLSGGEDAKPLLSLFFAVADALRRGDRLSIRAP